MHGPDSHVERPPRPRHSRGAAIGLLAIALMVGASGAAAADTSGATVQSLSLDGTGTVLNIDVTGSVLTVVGSGRVFVEPDLADVTLGVTKRADSAEQASADAAAAMAAVVASLLEAGIAEADVRTTQLNLYPVYDYETEPAPIVGWEISNTVSATVRDVEAVGDIVDGAIAAGANRIDGITFRVADPTAAETQARAIAVADANAKAGQLAAAAGLELGGILSLSEISLNPEEPLLAQGDTAGGAGFATPILPGNVELSVNVSVAYAVEIARARSRGQVEVASHLEFVGLRPSPRSGAPGRRRCPRRWAADGARRSTSSSDPVT